MVPETGCADGFSWSWRKDARSWQVRVFRNIQNPMAALVPPQLCRTRPNAGQALGGSERGSGSVKGPGPRWKRRLPLSRPAFPAAQALPKVAEASRVGEPKAAERAQAERRARRAGQRAAAPPVGRAQGAALEPEERRLRRGPVPAGAGQGGGCQVTRAPAPLFAPRVAPLLCSRRRWGPLRPPRLE